MPYSKVSRAVYAPCAVSSFFEICDREPDGSKITDILRIGSRGGGFVISKGNTTRVKFGDSIKRDSVAINGKEEPKARTTLKAVQLMREHYHFPSVKVTHQIEPPIGSGFGTSGAGAVGTVIAISDLFDLHLTLSQACAFAHRAEVESVTGLGTVISIISGSGAVGLVVEPGSYSVGRVDALLADYNEYSLICAWFGPIEKSTVLQSEEKRKKVNEYGRSTLDSILKERTPESLLNHSRRFAELTGIGSPELLNLADRAKKLGALGATQNMIGNSIHCLVPKRIRNKFLVSFGRLVPRKTIFETKLCHSGPKFLD
jgi:pantoate kinase